MNKRAIVVLTAITLALIAYVVLFERTSLTSKELGERHGRVLEFFVRNKVDRLEIQRKGVNVVLQRDRPDDEFGGWKMLSPAKTEADDDSVDKVMGELEWLSARRTLESLSADDVHKFGLDKPRYRVRYRAGDREHTLAIGNPDVHGEGVYVQVAGESRAFVVPKTLVETLDRDPLSYRSKEFLGEMTIAWGQRLEIQGPEGKIEAIKEKGRYWITGAVKTFADDKRIDTLLRGLDDLRAARFLEPNEAPQAAADLQKPARTVKLNIVPDASREDKKPMLVELQIGGACAGHDGERYARAGQDGAPVCIKNDDAHSFEVKETDLRLARPFSADSSAIESLQITHGASKVTLKRSGEKWLADNGWTLDREAVEQWLSDLGNQRAEAFLAPAHFQEQTSIKLALSDDRSERVAIGQASPSGGVFVQREGEPAQLDFPRSLADLFELSKLRFQPLEPWAAHQPSEVVAIDVRDGTTARKLVLTGGTWSVEKGAPLAASDLDIVRELVRLLVRTRIHGFVSEHVRPDQGLSEPRAELRIKLAQAPVGGALSGGATLSLDVGDPHEQGAFARVDNAFVAYIDGATIAQLRGLAGSITPSAALPVPEHPPDEDEEEHAGEGVLDDHH